MPEEIKADINSVLYSGNLSYGAHAKKYETALRDYIENPYLLTTSNNNFASIIALSLLDLREGDEIITSPMACLASNQPLVGFNVKVVWADIDPYTGTLDPESVRMKVTRNTKAIMHYHWCGFPGYIDEVNKIGKDNGILIIEDAIEAFGAEYKGKKIGNTGSDITLFSFQPVRLPTSIDGGAISFSNPSLFEKALRMRDWGIDRKSFRDNMGEISPQSDISHVGFNATMNEISGLIGWRQMEYLPGLLEQQRKNASCWDQIIRSYGSAPLSTRNETNPNYWVYSFLSTGAAEDLVKFREQGYYASKVHVRNDYYSCFKTGKAAFKGVSQFEKQQLSLPCGWWVNIL